MIKMQFKDLDKTGMLSGLRKLKVSNLPFKTAYHAGRILDLIEQQIKEARVGYLELTKKHALLDEEGKPKVDPERPNIYLIDDAKKELFKKEEKELFEVCFEIDKAKLKMSDLSELKLTPDEALSLEVLLEE